MKTDPHSSAITFHGFPAVSRFLDPRKGFEVTEESFEVRRDPLTGRTSHLSHFGAIKPQKLPLDAYATPEVRGFCPFCLENRDRKTPKFPPSVVPGGRFVRNETCLIPNLFPYDEWGGVAIMTDDHVVPLGAFTRERLTDAFSVGIEFLQRIREIDPAVPYPVMTWNYMPPSGGGLVHPHQQYFVTRHPGNQYDNELRASREFYDRSGSSYWRELAEEEERLKERYIGRVGSSVWFAAFAPLGLLGDVLCVFPETGGLEGFGQEELTDLVSGLLALFAYYADAGIFSFNASFFFPPGKEEYFAPHFRVAPRTFLNLRDFAPDLNFYQALLGEAVSVVRPEILAQELAPYFSDSLSG